MDNGILPFSSNNARDYLSKIPTELLNREIQIRLSAKVDKIESELQELKAVYDRDKNVYVDLFTGQQKSLQSGLEKISYVTTDPNVYKTLTQIGHLFIPNITAEQLGLMLIKFGLAQKFKQNINGQYLIAPYTNDLNSNNPIAKATPHILDNGKEVINYRWNAEMVKQKILKKLESIGRLYEFQTLKTPKDITNFVKTIQGKD